MESNGDKGLSISSMLDKIMKEEEIKVKKKKKEKAAVSSTSHNKVPGKELVSLNYENRHSSQPLSGMYQTASLSYGSNSVMVNSAPTPIPPPLSMGLHPSTPYNAYSVPANLDPSYHNVPSNFNTVPVGFNKNFPPPVPVAVPPPLTKTGAHNIPFPVPPKPSYNHPFLDSEVKDYKNSDGRKSSGRSSSERSSSSSSSSKKHKNKSGKMPGAAVAISIPLPLPPPPSPPKLLMHPSFRSQSLLPVPLPSTPPPPPPPSSHNSSFRPQPRPSTPPHPSSSPPPTSEMRKEKRSNHKRPNTSPVSLPILSEIPLPPPSSHPPEPPDSPPKSPEEDGYSGSGSRRSKRNKRESSKKSSSRKETNSNEEDSNEGNKCKEDNYHKEMLDWQMSDKGFALNSSRHNFSPFHEGPSFNGHLPYNHRGGRPPFHPGMRPFRPFGIRPPFKTIRNRPPAFHAMEERPYGPGRGSPYPQMGAPFPPPTIAPFGSMERGPPSFRPPFNHMGEPPPFRSSFSGAGPPYSSMGGQVPYSPNNEGVADGCGSHFGSKSNQSGDNEDYPYDHNWSPESNHSHKNHRSDRRDRRSKSQSIGGERSKSSEKEKPQKEAKRRKSSGESTAKKKLRPDYDLEPGECLSSESDQEMESLPPGSGTRKEENSSSSDESSSSSSSSSDDSFINLDFLKSRKLTKGKATRFDKYMDNDSKDGSSSEVFNSPPEVLEKPKFPRYFKDKVAFSKDSPDFLDKPLTPAEVNFGSLLPDLTAKPKVDSVLKMPSSSPPIASESLKTTKTPLIKRLGLEEEMKMKEREREEEERRLIGRCNISGNSFDFVGDYKLSATDKEGYLDDQSEKERTLTKYFNSPSEFYEYNRQRSGSLSPNSSLDYEEFKLLASTKEILSASKSIFKSPNSPKASTTKKYEKPSIKVKTVGKSTPIKSVHQSPHRIDLDSRIKILFGLRSSGDENSPEKKNFKNAAFNYRNMKLLSRPPSPFRSKNAYQYWHRETYYFRKNNPIPEEFADPTVKRKINSQIEGQNVNETGVPEVETSESFQKPDGDSQSDNLQVSQLGGEGGLNPSTKLSSEDLSGKESSNPSKAKGREGNRSNCNFDSGEDGIDLGGPSASEKSGVSRKSSNSIGKEARANCGETNEAASRVSNVDIMKIDFEADSEMEMITGSVDDKGTTQTAAPEPDDGLITNSAVVSLILEKIVSELRKEIRSELTEALIGERMLEAENKSSRTELKNQRHAVVGDGTDSPR